MVGILSAMKIKNYLIFLVLGIISGACASYFACNRYFKARIEALTPKEVQVIVYDTLRVVEPIFVERRIVKKDTIKIPIMDTLIRKDTIYLQREQKVYADSTYRAVVSGVQPRLDSIQIYQKTIIQTKIATQKEWRKFDYGLQVGVGAVVPFYPQGGTKVALGGYIGFGVNYHF